MAFSPGSKLGPYEILSPLGAGGMGEVYRARDTKLGRDVALKVLPSTFAGDAERMARFQREAQVLASLNHPHIAAIYGLEESGSTRALVMELVEGPTLAELIKTRNSKNENRNSQPEQQPNFEFRISSFQFPVSSFDVLQVGRQIAEGLEAAHEKGIIHRDLKPANIKVTPDGTVKVLDFGLAKATAPDISSANLANSPTLSIAATEAGVILGTAAYMSPEQAKGKSIDRRTDIWAFGCVLYEMLTGTPAFEGETASDVLAAVIRAEPEWSALPATTPAPIQKLVRRCLYKDPKHRLQAIGEARIAIEEYLVNPAPEAAPPPLSGVAQTVAQPRKNSGAVILAAGLTLLVGLAVGWWVKGSRTTKPSAWSAHLLGGPNIAMGGRISPDGRTLAFQAMVGGMTQVAVMDTESGDWTVLTKDRTRGYVAELNWSLDGSLIYFDRQFSGPRGIYTVSRFGGDERLVLEDAMGPELLPDGSLLVVRVNKDRDFQIHHYWADSGRLEPLNGYFENIDVCPSLRAFHDGKSAVFFGKTLDQPKTDPLSHLYVLELDSGKARRLAPDLNLVTSVITFFPLAVPMDDQSVLVDSRQEDLHQILEIPRSGSGPVRTLFSLTAPPMFMDVAKDGSIYLDQALRPIEILRFSATGGTPEVLARSDNPRFGSQAAIQLADGRVMIDAVVAGQTRLLFAKPGGEAVPFIATKEESSMPACRLGADEIAFRLGPPSDSVLAIASSTDGRIIRRLKGPGNAAGIEDIHPSSDGKTLYYVSAGTVWSVPVEDGQPQRIGPGDSLAVEPDGKKLLVQLREKEGIQLAHVPIAGGPQQLIHIQSQLLPGPVAFGPNVFGKDGRVLMSLGTPDAWFYAAGFLDLRTGKIDKIPLNFQGDLLGAGWLPDGHILASGWPIEGKLWRFRPEAVEMK